MHVIGLDVGTTSTKALVIREDGAIVGSGSMGYKLYSEGNCVEQDANDWWKAAIYAVREATADVECGSIEAISLSTQGATMLAIDKNNHPILNALTWMDSRSINQARQIEEILGEDYIYQTCGWPLLPSGDAAKILYMKQTPIYGAAIKYLSTIEYMNLMLTGKAVIDPTNAGIRQIFDVKAGVWDEKILEAIECTQDELPTIMPAGALIGELLPDSAADLGLGEGVKVYNGAHDQFCASLGSGAVESGDMLISCGTTWTILSVGRKRILTPTHIASCSHPVTGLFGNLVSLVGSGSSYEWIKNSVFSGESYQEINDGAEERIGRKNELFFMPWLTGAFYPYWNPSARGGFTGADLSNDKFDLALSVMESAVFNVKATIEDFERNGCETRNLSIMGGATKSKPWMGILKSVLDLPIRKINVTDVCAVGAACIALCALRYFSSFKEAAEAIITSDEIEDAGYSKEDYRRKYQQYQKTVELMISLYEG